MVAVFGSLLALISVISSLRYEHAITLPEDDSEAANIAVLSLILVCLSTLLSGLILWLFGQSIADILGVPELVFYFWLLPFGVLLGGAYQVFNYWSVRTKRFSSIAATKVHQALATLTIQLAAYKLGGIALLYARVVGESVGTTKLGWSALTNSDFRKVNWQGIVKGARRYRRFPYFSTWEGFLNSASVELIPIVFTTFFSPSAVGLFSLAHRVITLPMGLIGNSISQVFTSVAPSKKRNGSISELVLVLHKALAYFALPPLMMLAIYGQNLFEYIFSSEWRVSGEFAQWMSLWLYFQFISSPLSSVFSVYELQKEGLFWQILLLFLRMVAIFAGVAIGDILNTVILFSLASSVYYILFTIRIATMTGTCIADFICVTFKGFFAAVCCNVPLIFAIVFSDSDSNHHFVGFALSVILITFWIVYIIRKNLNHQILR